MNVLIAVDKFKGSLSSSEVATAIAAGLNAAATSTNTGLEITAYPISDGGDGFLDAVQHSLEHKSVSSKFITVPVKDPLGRDITARFLMAAESGNAYVELAAASGLELLSSEERNPLRTSTFGTGQLITAAIQRHARNVFVGIGGSATNDGGTGLASALGVRFFDREGELIDEPTGSDLGRIERIETSQRVPLVPIVAVNDVSNPLFGKTGAAHIYAAQKGATPEQIESLDQGLRNLAITASRDLGNAGLENQPGAGAAGGVGFGLTAFCDAQSVSGSEFVSQQLELAEQLATGAIDLVITGEGKIDDQTLDGKWVNHIADLARSNDVPVVAFCGQSHVAQEQAQSIGLRRVISIHDASRNSVQYSIDNAGALLSSKAQDWFQRFLQGVSD